MTLGTRQPRRFVLAAVLSLLVMPSGALASSASTAGASADNPLPLDGTVSGQLAANSGGSFAYFAFVYPGDGSAVTLSLTVDNPVPLEQGAAGINAYMNGDLVGSGAQSDINRTNLFFSSPVAGEVLVQVYNYSGASAENFTLVPAGLPGQVVTTTTSSATTATAAPTVTVSTISTTSASNGPKEFNGSAAGILKGSVAGNFAMYTYVAPAGSAGVALTLTIDPAIVQENKAAGLNVYDAGGNLAAAGQPVSPGVVTAVLVNPAGTYTLQVFNYDPAKTIGYALVAESR